MPLLRCQVVIPYRTALPEDVAVNTFHFEAVDTGETVLGEILGRLAEFYNVTVAGIGDKLTTILSGELAITGTRLKIYDLSDPEPRPPIFDESLGISGTPTSTTNLPAEVALCTSYAASPEAGTVAARRRGRIYLGPFCATASGTAHGTNPARPSTGVITGVVAATKRLCGENSSGIKWVVYSRANDDAVEVRRGWVDNAFDTQRRRGTAASSRTTWVEPS